MSLINPHLLNVTPWNPKHVEQVHKERIKFSFTNYSRYLIAGPSHLKQTINQVEAINEKHTKF